MNNKDVQPITSTEIIIVGKPKGRPKGSKNKPKKRKRKPNVKKEINTNQAQDKISVKQSLQLHKNWDKYLVRVDDEIAENKPILMIGEHLLVSAGGLVTLSGKPKSYKTFLSSAIVGAFIKGEYMGMFSKCADSNAKALILDTEQGKARTQIVQRRIYSLCDNDTKLLDSRLIVLSVRELSPKDRTRVLLEAINDIKPKLVVIDGVRDLIKDFNNIEESVEVVNQLMRVASELDCAIIVIIHQNKGDSNTRGHLGSELCNKSETVIEMKRQIDNSVVVSPMYCRDIEFEEFAMKITDEGLPVLCPLPTKNKENRTDTLRTTISDAMNNASTIGRKELIDKIVLITQRSQKTAERRISDAVNEGLITLLPDGKTYTLINDNQ